MRKVSPQELMTLFSPFVLVSLVITSPMKYSFSFNETPLELWVIIPCQDAQIN